MKRRKREKYLSTYVVILFVSLSLFFTASFSIYTLYKVISTGEKEINESVTSLIYGINNNIDLVLNKMNHTSIILLNNLDVVYTMKKLQEENITDYDTIQLSRKLYECAVISCTTTDYYYINYYNKLGELICTSSGSNNTVSNLFKELQIRPQQINQYSLQLSEQIFVPKDSEEKKERVYMLVKPVFTSAEHVLGYVAIICDEDTINSAIMNGLKNYKQNKLPYYSLKLYDKNNQLIRHWDRQSPYPSNKNSTLKNYSSYTGLTLTMEYSYHYFIEQTFLKVIPILLIGGGCIVLSSIIIIIMLMKFFYPLKKLTILMDNVKNGDYSGRIQVTTPFSDIKIVLYGYNTMVQQIDTLVTMVYNKEIEMKSYYIQILKSQINPHFLYNTLQTIEALGEIHNAPQIQEIAYNLGKMLRYNLKANEIVDFEEELQSVIYYLEIQRVRFSNKIHYQYKVQADCNHLKIIKFIVQPFVENCIIHGFKDPCKVGHILISAESKDLLLYIYIVDNGKGMSTQQVKEINDLLKNPPNKIASQHIGIINVHRRIQLVYGKKYGVQIKSQLNKGTIITLTIPIREGNGLV